MAENDSIWSYLSWTNIFKTALTTLPEVFGFVLEETPRYHLLQRFTAGNGLEVEIRRYEPKIVATVVCDRKDDAFRTLAKYIFGKNAKADGEGNNDVAMTAPVRQTQAVATTSHQSEDVAMTAPVRMAEGDGHNEGPTCMEFVMPSKYTLETLPRPLDSRVQLQQQPEEVVAVVVFSGSLDGQRESKKAALREALEGTEGVAITGRPFTAGYNPPFTLPFLRTNEVGFPVELRGGWRASER